MRRSGERDGALAVEMVEQIAGASADQLDRSRRKNLRLDHRAEHGLGEIRRDRRRLDDRRNAGEERGRELLEHSPHGKVERVDVHRDAFDGHADVTTDERAAFRERLQWSVDKKRLVGKIAAAARGVREQRPDAAVDVDPAVRLRGAGGGGHEVELVLPRHQILRHRLEHPRPLVERHPAQRRSADGSRVLDHGSEIESLARRRSDPFTGDGVKELGTASRAPHPFADGVALQPRSGEHEALRRFIRQYRCHVLSNTTAMPCPTPMHIVHSA